MNQPAFDLFSYPNAAGFKRTDTSRAAAESINAAAIQAKVLNAFRRFGPMTADQCAIALNIDKGTIRPRCSELRRKGMLADTGVRRPNSSGKSAQVLKAVP